MKVMAFGTFDLFHPGHRYFLEKAAGYGELFVVIALDKTVKEVKGRLPQESQDERLRNVLEQPVVRKAMLGRKGDKYSIIEEIRPDVICLGYDQKVFTGELEKELSKRGIDAKIVRIDAYKSDIYKSSKMRG